MQSDVLTLPAFCQHVQNIIGTLNDLKINQIASGFEYTLSKQMEKRDGKFYLKNIELYEQGHGRRQPLEIGEMRNK